MPPYAPNEGDAFDEPIHREQCGTPQGYRLHLKNGEPRCAPCKAAWAYRVSAYKKSKAKWIRVPIPLLKEIEKAIDDEALNKRINELLDTVKLTGDRRERG